MHTKGLTLSKFRIWRISSSSQVVSEEYFVSSRFAKAHLNLTSARQGTEASENGDATLPDFVLLLHIRLNLHAGWRRDLFHFSSAAIVITYANARGFKLTEL